MSIVLGTPSQRLSTSSSSGATSGSSLVVHSLAPNNLAAANTAFRGASAGVVTFGTLASTRRTVTLARTSSLNPNLGAVISAGTIPSTEPSSTAINSTVGTVPVFNVPTTPGTTATNTTGGTNVGSGAVVFTNPSAPTGTAVTTGTTSNTSGVGVTITPTTAATTTGLATVPTTGVITTSPGTSVLVP